MKAFGGILVIFIVLLSLYQASSHFVKPWHLCKTKEVTDPPTPCNALECSGLCGSMYTGGIGICIADSCECLHSCFKEGPPHSVNAMQPVSSIDVKTPQTLISSSSMEHDLNKHNENVSKMGMSSNDNDEEVVKKNEGISKVVFSSNSMDLKKDQVKPDRFSENVAVSTSHVVEFPI